MMCDTLAHEMCHAAQHLISLMPIGQDRLIDRGHGPLFYHWRDIVMEKSREHNLDLRVGNYRVPIEDYKIIEVPTISIE